MGPSYANLFVGFIENKFFSNYHGPKPNLYKRFIDDCVGATSSSKEELDHFITAVNSFHWALKYTREISENSLAFLDIKISINGNSLSTSVHYKPTDSHNYLLHLSSHPQHVKNAIPFSQFLRLRRLCSNDSDFNNKCEEMYQFFKKPRLRSHHRQTSCPRNRSKYRTTITTKRRNQQNYIHPHLPSTKPCSQKCNSQKLQNSPQ